ncbi:MAG: plastocyanin/azurin family copper-binding protein [Nitriliruptoraceae bacterium]
MPSSGGARRWRLHGRRSLLLLLAAVAGLTLLVAGCTSGPEFARTIDMEDNFFDRDVTRIAEGEAVRFRNRGVVPHNAIDVGGTWSTGEALGGDRLDLMDPGEEVVVTFDEPGVYRFYCSLHASDDGSSGMAATLVVGDVPFSAAGEDAPTEPVTEWTGVTRRVPEDHPTIQNAVDAADPGDLVLISPAPETDAHRAEDGRYVYFEQVDIATPYLTVRGTDRNAVIIDGEHQRPIGINTVAADGVAVENLTVRNTTGNGIYWTAVRGYRGSYLTAINNAIYGIYAFDSTDGLFEHSYASGSKDAGFYVGQCDPCDAILTGVTAELNGMGYSGTNASDVFLVDSVWRHNVSGIVPNTLDSQRLPPFGRVTIAGNLIHDNDSREAPALGLQWSAFGNGVLLTGGMDSLVTRNRIVNHERTGVTIGPNLSRNFWMSGGNVVTDNVIEGSGYADVVLAGPALAGNCVAGNAPSRTVPAALEAAAGCGPAAVAGAQAGPADPDRGAVRLPSRFHLAPTLSFVGLVAESEFGLQPDNDHRDTPHPPDQPTLPDPQTAPVVPAVDVFEGFGLDLAAIEVPDAPDGLVIDQAAVPLVAGVPLGLGAFSTLYGVLGWLGPFALLVAWVALALLDLARRDDLGAGATTGWTAVVLLVPFAGAPVYLLAGGAALPRWLRWWSVLGALAVAVVLLGAAAVVGGLL